MKKLHLLRALFVGLLVWLPSAWLHAADWMAVGLYEQGAFYIDRETISRTGSIASVQQPGKNLSVHTHLDGL
jgi:hypothetical protein